LSVNLAGNGVIARLWLGVKSMENALFPQATERFCFRVQAEAGRLARLMA
jgi:hypothetical protein